MSESEDNFDTFLIPSGEERVSPNKIVPFRQATKRGTIIRRVTPRGKVVGDPEIVLHTFVSGVADDPYSIKYISTWSLKSDNGRLTAGEGLETNYDPELTVEKLGEVDYLDPKNAHMFGDKQSSSVSDEPQSTEARLDLPPPSRPWWKLW